MTIAAPEKLLLIDSKQDIYACKLSLTHSQMTSTGSSQCRLFKPCCSSLRTNESSLDYRSIASDLETSIQQGEGELPPQA